MKRTLGSYLLAAAMLMPVCAAAEVDYPADTVRLFVPANPGGGTDAGARLFAEFFEKHSDATVAIINQPSGGGVVAAQTVLRGKPDGSTLLLFHGALHTAHLFGQSPLSWESFTPLATSSAVNEVFAVRSGESYTNLNEFLDYAKASPGKLNMGSQLGGTTQVKGEAINRVAEGSLRIVDAGTESDRVTALLGKQVDIISMNIGTAKQYVEDGQMTVLAVMSDEADPIAPEFPTAISQGIEFSMPLVMTIYGPPNANPSVVEAFDAVMAEIAADPDFPTTLLRQAHVPAVRGPAETKEFVAQEYGVVADLLAE